MQKNFNRSTVPISDWSNKELDHMEKLRCAQEEAVIAILQRNAPVLREYAENASNFAEDMTIKLRHRASPPVACASGCSSCCYQLVKVTGPEIFRIIQHLRENTLSAESDRIITRVKQLDKATRASNDKSRHMVKKPCAFLDDGKCSIYKVRPMSCAEFTSYDVVVCKRGMRKGFKAGGVIHEKARMLAYYAIHQGMIDGLTKAFPDADHSALELTTAFVDAWDHPNAESAWKEGEKIFAKAHLK